MGTIKATNIEPIADNGTVTLGSSGDTFTLGSGVIQSNLIYPAWSAKRGSDQTGIADSTNSLVICDTEELDSDGAYNTSTGVFTVPTGKGGKYMAGASFRTNASGTATRIVAYLYVGSTATRQFNNNQNSSGEASSNIHAVLNLSAGDEVSFRMYQNTGSAVNATSTNGATYFYGYRIGT